MGLISIFDFILLECLNALELNGGCYIYNDSLVNNTIEFFSKIDLVAFGNILARSRAAIVNEIDVRWMSS